MKFGIKVLEYDDCNAAENSVNALQIEKLIILCRHEHWIRIYTLTLFLLLSGVQYLISSLIFY